MKLYFSGHDYKYAVEQILLNLFPDERPEYPDFPASGDFIYVSLSEGKKYLTSVCKIVINNNPQFGKARILAASNNKFEKTGKETFIIQKAIYNAFINAGFDKPEWGSISGVRPTKLYTKELENYNFNSHQTKLLFKKLYDVSDERIELLSYTANYSISLSNRLNNNDVCLYIGIPFCPTRCTYCSFISSDVKNNSKLINPYLDCLLYEIKKTASILAKRGLNIISIYIGGGTPTTLNDNQLDKLLGCVEESFDLSSLIEYSVEAGRPDTITIKKLKVLKKYGVNRVSVNPQTMSDEVLEIIGRKHSSSEIFKALDLVHEVGDFSINMDLIAGLPGDTVECFKKTIDTVLSIEPENITVHTLSKKKGSSLNSQLYSGALIPNGNEVREMLNYSNSKLYSAGYFPYYLYRQKFMSGGFENTGWSKHGYENIYNVCIMEELCSIIALGAGGSTKLIAPGYGKNERFISAKYPKEYIDKISDICENKMKISEFCNEYSIG